MSAAEVEQAVTAVLDRHTISAFSPEDSACRCDRRWRKHGAYRAHVAAEIGAALAPLLAAERARALDEAAEAIAAMLPYGYGMNPDGTEDSQAGAYVQGHYETWALVRERADREREATT